VLRTQQPDTDNYCKGALDAMTGVIYENDGVVSGLIAFKRYCLKDEQPGTIITVYWSMP